MEPFDKSKINCKHYGCFCGDKEELEKKLEEALTTRPIGQLLRKHIVLEGKLAKSEKEKEALKKENATLKQQVKDYRIAAIAGKELYDHMEDKNRG